MATFLIFFRKFGLPIITWGSLLLGVGVGILLIKLKWTPQEASQCLIFPVEIFVRILQSLAVPLAISSIISSLGEIKLEKIKKIALWSTVFYGITTTIAVMEAIIIILTMNVGKDMARPSYDSGTQMESKLSMQDAILDVMRNLIPFNLVQAFVQHVQTFSYPSWLKIDSSHKYTEGANVLGLLLCSVVFGVTLRTIGPEGKILINIAIAFNKALIKITSYVAWISPIAIFFLMFGIISQNNGEFYHHSNRLTYRILIGLIIHGFITMIIYVIFVRRLPLLLITQFNPVLGVTFSANFSMPISIHTLDAIKVDTTITRIVIPIGSVINVSGAMLYEVIAVVFLAQNEGITLNYAKIVLTTLLVSMANPHGSFLTIMVVSQTIGLPLDSMVTIIRAQWILGGLRTTIDVWCDCLAASFVSHMTAKSGPVVTSAVGQVLLENYSQSSV